MLCFIKKIKHSNLNLDLKLSHFLLSNNKGKLQAAFQSRGQLLKENSFMNLPSSTTTNFKSYALKMLFL